jgi:hypothetical protein
MGRESCPMDLLLDLAGVMGKHSPVLLLNGKKSVLSLLAASMEVESMSILHISYHISSATDCTARTCASLVSASV